MQRDWICRTGRLGGTSEFTVLAPIKPGLVPALDALSYKTRVKRVLRTLHAGRLAGFEHELARVLSDAVERVGRIHSVSIRVLEPQDAVMLAVVFDGAWEAYVRVIWQKVTRLLDLVFCHTVDYPLGWDSSYATWSDWLRSVQTETTFLYATPGLTVPDTRYLRLHERLYRRETGAATDAALLQLTAPSAEELADALLVGDAEGIRRDLSNPVHGLPPSVDRMAFRSGVRSLVGLHRLVDWFPVAQGDAEVLRRAAHELLPEFTRMLDPNDPAYEDGRTRLGERFPDALAWFKRHPGPDAPPPAARQPPVLPPVQPLLHPETVQGGIVTPFPDTDHGVLLLLGLQSPAGLAALLQHAGVTTEADVAAGLPAGAITVNLGLTPAALRLAGVPDDELQHLPEPYMQGMEARCGWLGDVRVNHPRRWRLPVRNWADGISALDLPDSQPAPRIAMEAVHAVLQLRHVAAPAEMDAQAIRQRLLDALQARCARHPDIVPLSLQWMGRLPGPQGAAGGAGGQEHFGFSDGRSNPVFDAASGGRRYKNQVHLGEALCGHPNRADQPATAPEGSPRARALALQHNGSYWVVRKLRQDIGALEALLETAGRRPGTPDRETLLSLLMGRWPSVRGDGTALPPALAGSPLATVPNPAQPNDFNFNGQSGAKCPLQAHIRLANPRETDPKDFTRPPRIIRRGMSYGPPFQRGEIDAQRRQDDLARERGLVFMAYNASIGEQFEVVQRWLMGGNSTGSFSGHQDPFLGLPEPGHRRSLCVAHNGQALRLELDGSDALQGEPAHAEPMPLVRLEWGVYLLTPSTLALDRLAALAAAPRPGAVPAWRVEDGLRQLAALKALEASAGAAAAAMAWKQALEDPDAGQDFLTAALWQAIRVHHGGVLRTPYGVLVADATMIADCQRDAHARLSARGYQPRLRPGLGEMYLGMDKGQADAAYERESARANAAIMALDPADTFHLARDRTHHALDRLVQSAIDEAREGQEQRWQLTVDLRELVDPVLADFCETWFALSEQGGHFRRGGMRWDWQPGQPPTYPGHFMAPSRHVFQPLPGETAEAIGVQHGRAALEAMRRFLDAHAQAILGAGTASVACAVLKAGLVDGLDTGGGHAFSARTLAGAVMGFVPTVDGNLRRVAHEWLRDGTLWTLRGRHAGQPAPGLHAAHQRLGLPLRQAMQLRAVPDTMWRTATVTHTLGAGAHQVTVLPGDRVVLGLASGTQQGLLADAAALPAAADEPGPALSLAFGGDRWSQDPPTHACPGSHAAMSLLLGFFSALVESTHALRPGPGSLTLAADGDTGLVVQARADAIPRAEPARVDVRPAAAVMGDGWAAVRHLNHLVPVELPAAAPRGRLTHIGDSWLATPLLPGMPTLYQALLERGLLVNARLARAARLLSELRTQYTTPGDQGPLARYLRDLDPATELPSAILLTAGGNDLVHSPANPPDPRGTPLYGMLRPGATDGAAAIDDDRLGRFLETLRGHYDALLAKIAECCADYGLPEIPVLVHGYDHPIPRATGFSTYLGIRVGPWLQPIFQAGGIDDAQMQREAMVKLIDGLNCMVHQLQQDHPGRVHHLNLRGVLAQASGGQPETLWKDELHPTQTGFGHVADRCIARLEALQLIN